jgi:membrane fusion protein (multidrug efflux system)
MRAAIARLLAAVSLAVALALAIGACKKRPAPAAPPTPTVRVVMVQARNVPLIRQWLATLDGSTTAQIQPQVTGYIVAVNYREGSTVEKGQLLFTLDKRPFIAAVEKARGDYEQAIAALEKSKADVARYTPLVAEHAISREQLDNARAAVRGGVATVKATKAALETAKINLAWTDVRSPIRGLAGLAQTRVGTLVSPNQVLTIVSTLDPMRASFSISQQAYLQYADAINRLNAPEYAQRRYFELILVDGSIYRHRATQVVVNRQIDPLTGTLQIQAFFPNPEGLLRPGLFGRVRLHAGTSTESTVVPERAVTELQGQYQVAIVDEQQGVQVRQVKVGQVFDHEYVVESGLRPGERVIIEGLVNVLPGTKVKASQVQTVGRPPAGRQRPTDGVAPDGGIGPDGGAAPDGGVAPDKDVAP